MERRRAPHRHDHDAGGDPAILAAKAALRRQVWSTLDRPGVRSFPGPEQRIPNFVGAATAAEGLRSTAVWQEARTVKANPDRPQWPVRQRALEDGKRLYMAVPRLVEENPFFVLDPERLRSPPRQATSIRGAERSARTVPLSALTAVDLVITGCVAAAPDGSRLGKGGGFSDLEFALAQEAGLIGPRTLIATTVHPLQLLAAGVIPMTPHDVPLDLIVTPEGILECTTTYPRPRGLDWSALTAEKIAALPLLRKLTRHEPTHHTDPAGAVS